MPVSPLPGARREIAAVSRLLPGERVTVLQGREARVDRLREWSRQSTVIHLAKHAIARVEHTFDAREIFGLNLYADLVFLSACRSGPGR